jgi:hypothetical protein
MAPLRGAMLSFEKVSVQRASGDPYARQGRIVYELAKGLTELAAALEREISDIQRRLDRFEAK